MYINDLKVIGASDTSSNPFNNMLLLEVDGTCQDTNLFYISNDDSAYQSILSVALAAFVSNTQIYPAIITSATKSAGMLKAEKLLWMRLKK